MQQRSPLLAVLDWWRPRRALSPSSLFQLRCVVSGALFGLVVSGYSLAQSAEGSLVGQLMLGAYATGCILLLVGAKAGLSPSVLAWAAILHLGLFLSAVALIPASTRQDQLFWLVLMPVGARALFPEPSGSPDAIPTASGRAMLIGAVAAVALGFAVLVAQDLGWTLGRTTREIPTVIKGTEHLLFIACMVGLLSLHELTVRATVTELQRLQRLITYCAWCHDVCDDHGTWMPPDQYLAGRVRAPVTHGMCPTCAANPGTLG